MRWCQAYGRPFSIDNDQWIFIWFVTIPKYKRRSLINDTKIINGTNNQFGFPAEQIQSHILLSLDQYDNGMQMVHIFSGLWLLLFGYLILKSGFLPKTLGVLLMLDFFGYLVNSVGHSLIPTYSKIGISSFISLPASIGEIGTCLWLLIMEQRTKKQLDHKNTCHQYWMGFCASGQTE